MNGLSGNCLSRAALPAILLCLCSIPTGPAVAADARAVMREARQSYYSLRDEGFAGFLCNIAPDWRALLSSQGSLDPAMVERAVQELDRLRFSVSVDAVGRATITHNTIPAENEKALKALQQIYTGMEQMATGFFRTWALFVISAPLPRVEDDYALEELPEQYNVVYKDSYAQITTAMTRDYAVSRIGIKINNIESVFEPRFGKTDKGYLLSAYQAIVNVNSPPAERTELQVNVEHQLIEGMQLPRKLDVRGRVNNESYAVEIAFTECSALRRSGVAASFRSRRPS